MQFASIPEAIEETRAGRMLVVVDDEDRENEGDLTIAAEKATPEVINFMAAFGRGLICLTLTGERCDTLRLPLMSPHNTSNFGTAFCESIDAREGVTTGISAADRTRTILAAIQPDTRPGDLARRHRGAGRPAGDRLPRRRRRTLQRRHADRPDRADRHRRDRRQLAGGAWSFAAEGAHRGSGLAQVAPLPHRGRGWRAKRAG